jgi:hypothetical protein
VIFRQKSRKSKIIAVSIFLVFVGGGLLLLYFFLTSLGPAKIIITKDFVKTNRDFINGVNIEKIQVDSMGTEGYPIKYTTLYTTSCNIQHPQGRPPEPPDEIYFQKSGKYNWDEDTVKIQYQHSGLTREQLSKSDKLWWLNKFGSHPTCPLSFDKEQWYYFTFGDPQITGIFFYIDSSGQEHQYFLASGVSPI